MYPVLNNDIMMQVIEELWPKEDASLGLKHHFSSTDPSGGRAAVLALVLSSKRFLEPGLDAMWRNLPSVFPFFRLLESDEDPAKSRPEDVKPGDIIGSMVPIPKYSPSSWARFNYYASRVRGLQISGGGAAASQLLLALSANIGTTPISLSIEHLLWDHNPADIFPYMTLFYGPALKRLTVTAISLEAELRTTRRRSRWDHVSAGLSFHPRPRGPCHEHFDHSEIGDSETEVVNGMLTPASVRFLLEFTKMRVFSFISCSVCWDDDFIANAAPAWPNLELLHLGCGSLERALTRVTLRGLLPLARHCPRLERLKLQLDAWFKDDARVWEQRDWDHRAPWPLPALEFQFGEAPDLAERHVARWLKTYFPNIHSVSDPCVQFWLSCNLPENQDLTEEEYVERHEGEHDSYDEYLVMFPSTNGNSRYRGNRY